MAKVDLMVGMTYQFNLKNPSEFSRSHLLSIDRPTLLYHQGFDEKDDPLVVWF